MLLFPSHRQRSKREGAIIKGELKSHMHGIEQHLLAYQFDLQLLMIKVPCDFPYLTHRIVHKATAFAPIMKGQTYTSVDSTLRFVITNVVSLRNDKLNTHTYILIIVNFARWNEKYLTLSSLVLADKRRCSHSWIRELQVFVKIV